MLHYAVDGSEDHMEHNIHYNSTLPLQYRVVNFVGPKCVYNLRLHREFYSASHKRISYKTGEIYTE